MKCSAGPTSWIARQGQRFENAADFIFAAGEGLRFDDPDVSEVSHTKSVLKGLMGGESTVVYILSRTPCSQLASCLQIDIAGVRAGVSASPESLQGVALGNHWLSLFGGSLPKSFAKNSSILCTRLRNRIEDDLSFCWNLPSTSGSTAALGRARTEKRPPVAKEKQPAEPTLKSLPVQQQQKRGGLFGSGNPPLGAQQGCIFDGGAQPVTRGGSGFSGGGGFSFGGGGVFGSGGGGGMKSMAMSDASPCLFGAAPSAPAASRCAAGPPAASPSWGLSGSSPPPSMGFFGGGKGGGKGGGNNFFGGPESSVAPEPKTPSALLEISSHMRCGPSETPQEAFSRGMAAVKQLITYGVNSAAAPAAAEDPLVASILGTIASTNASTQAVHYGFTCDATGQNPIIGDRFKATNSANIDITAAARRAGSLAGGAGFRAIKNRTEAMRFALTSILSWWWLLWPSRSDLFCIAIPNLQSMSESMLLQAISKLPNAELFRFAP